MVVTRFIFYLALSIRAAVVCHRCIRIIIVHVFLLIEKYTIMMPVCVICFVSSFFSFFRTTQQLYVPVASFIFYFL